MAIGAVGSIGIVVRVGFTVSAGEEIFGDLSMAVGAVHTSRRFAGSLSLGIDIGVAFDTGNVFVCRFLDVLFGDCKRDFLSFYLFDDVFCFMTFQALPVRGPDNQTGPVYRVRLVAVRAGWNSTWLPFPKFSLDNFGVDFFDPGMAFGAGCGDVTC
jgi:hypothetical protein